MTKQWTVRIGYVSPESGYTMMRSEVFPFTTIKEKDAALDTVADLNRSDGPRLGVTFSLYTA
jgi:hypothetical protein